MSNWRSITTTQGEQPRHPETFAIGGTQTVVGAAMGSQKQLAGVRQRRSAIGTQVDPLSYWMLGRSLETFSLGIQKANDNARVVAEFLTKQRKISQVNCLSFFSAESVEG